MFALQDHVAPRIENVPHIGFLIFTVQAQQNSGVMLLNEEILQFAVRFRKRNPRRPDFAANAAPQRVIAVGNQGFNRRAV